MLSNQISTKDLFSFPMSRHGGRDQNDSALPCSQGNSQFLNSQAEYSQLSFQDSQMPESQSQSDSDGRRMYQKYMSKGSLFRPEGGSSSSHHMALGKVSHQEFLQAQKARARERDERDLLRSIMSIVNDSSAEVRSALQSFMDSVDGKQGRTEDNLSTSFKKLSEDLKKNCDKVIESVTERDGLKEELHSLQKEISKRDGVISGLEQQLRGFEQRQENRILEALKDCHVQQQAMLEEKLQKLLNVTSEQLKLYDKQASWQSEQQSEHSDVQREIFKEHQSHLKRLEEKLLKEMSCLQQDFEENQVRLGKYYKQQLQESHRLQAQSVESCVQQSLVAGLREASRDTSSMFAQQRQEIDSTWRKHKRELEDFVKTQLSKQLAEYDNKIKDVIVSLQATDPVKDRSAVVNTSEVCTVTDGSAFSKGRWVTLPLRSPKVPNQVHVQSGGNPNDVGYTCDFESITIKSPEFQLTSSYSRSNVIPSTASSLFGSPWNSKTLFGKSTSVRPSPVATVAPMVQEKNPNNIVKSSGQEMANESKVPTKQRVKRQRGIVQPQRRSQRLNKDSQDSSQDTNLKTETERYTESSICKPSRKSYNPVRSSDKEKQTKASSIYDFSEERPAVDNSCKEVLLKRKTRQWDNSEPDWLKVAGLQKTRVAKYDDDAAHGCSSPPMSLMEVVVKRRVKRDRTPQVRIGFSQHSDWGSASKKSVERRDKETFDDLLSTPCFRSFDGLAESSQNQAPIVWEGKISRKETGKRKLCDLNYDTQITEITQSIRRHMQRVKPR